MILKSEILTEIADRHRKRIMGPKAKKRRVLNNVEVEQIRISFLGGATVAQLARDMDVSNYTINTILKGYGVYRYDEETT